MHESKPLYVNLSHLAKPLSKAHRVFSFIAGSVLLVISVSIFINSVSGERSPLSMLFSLSYLCFGSYNIWISYTGKRSLPLNLKAYVQIDEEKMVFKPTYFSKTKTLQWQYIQYVEIKLFDLHFYLKNGSRATIDLATVEIDEDIKAIKDKVRDLTEIKGLLRKTENISI
jgi:hypothetical protein